MKRVFVSTDRRGAGRRGGGGIIEGVCLQNEVSGCGFLHCNGSVAGSGLTGTSCLDVGGSEQQLLRGGGRFE